MVPGKKYKPEDFIKIAWRRRWLIAVPFVVIGLATVVYAYFLPNRYRSESLILVVPQRVPENFVRSTVTTDVNQRLQTISQQILSRTRLERIILDLNLYPEERRDGIMEDVVERMRRQDISISIDQPRRRNEDTSSFRVGFTYTNPRIAMQVTERLASLFIEENIRDREILAEGTDQFLESQLEEARRQLLENERKLEEYKRRYAGQLPTQLQTNLQVLQNSQQQLQNVSESMLRDRDQRSLLDRMLADALAAGATATSLSGEPVTEASPAAVQLEAARRTLQQMALRFKPDHPDMVRAERIVKELEQKAEAEAAQQPLGPSTRPPSTAPVTPEEAARRRRIDDLRGQIAALDTQIASREREAQRLQGMIAAYQARVEAAPGREAELVALSRDYDTLQERYRSLLSKREDAKIAANLEKRQIGEQFKVIDAARLPERPQSPDRTRINLMGALAGLALGLGLAALLEYRDTSLREEEDVLIALAMPVLAAIPQLTTSVERQRRRRLKVALSLATGFVVLIGAAAAVWRLGLLGN